MSKPATAAGRRRAAARASAKAVAARRSKPPAARSAPAKPAKAKQSKPPKAKRSRTAKAGGATTPKATRGAKASKTNRGKAGNARRAKAARARSRALLGAIPQPRRLAVLAILLGALAVFYQGWLRDSSLVAVRDVEVKGVTSAGHKRITRALTAAAQGMTTLHLREDELEAAVSDFPTVESVSTDRSFPHGVAIDVTEREPTLLMRAGGQVLPVAADGTLLSGAKVNRKVAKALPVLEVGKVPGSARLEGKKLEVALVVGAAPGPLRPLIESVGWSSEGVEVTARGGIPITFASGARARAKWAAAAAILADRKLDTLSYLDVRVPERPAVGGAG